METVKKVVDTVEAPVHRIRITLTSRNVAALEKGMLFVYGSMFFVLKRDSDSVR